MDSITKAYEKHVNERHILGASCAVWVKGKEVYRNTFGYSDFEETIPTPQNAIYRLASMTKPITCVAALICKERGLLDFYKPISTYIEGFAHGGVAKLVDGVPVYEKPAREITLADIFTHTSGISGVLATWQFERMGEFCTLSECAEKLNGTYLEFAPEEKNAYGAILAFELAALAVERVTGKPYATFIQE